jgi:hypothetical protein
VPEHEENRIELLLSEPDLVAWLEGEPETTHEPDEEDD